ncbi:LysR family transcriptional regulator [Pseudoduganella sp. OTU4001]|uniref:LysR family transcriptional regulator n=1 Tax=Pseudoduganella sp. OTU4001 TaxID=3043854 RepID=UPI00313E184C
MNSFDWNDIPLILALARCGSMSAAARELGVDASTISRRVAAAEKALDLRLFLRDTSGYQLTAAGRIFVEYGETVAGNVQAMLLASSQESQAAVGVVRISAIDFLFDFWLAQHVAALRASHPALELHFLADNSNLSFARGETDFAIRLARPADDAALVMRRLGELPMAVFGTSHYADVGSANWAEQPWIGYDATLARLPETRWLERVVPRNRVAVRVNGLGSLVQVCRAGVGLALLPCMMERMPGLVRLGGVEVTREVWLLSHRDAVGIGRIRVVAEWLAASFAGASTF